MAKAITGLFKKPSQVPQGPAAAKIALTEEMQATIAVIKVHHPHIKVVYFDQRGNYHFHSRPGFAPFNVEDAATESTEVITAPVATPEPKKEKPGGNELDF